MPQNPEKQCQACRGVNGSAEKSEVAQKVLEARRQLGDVFWPGLGEVLCQAFAADETLAVDWVVALAKLWIPERMKYSRDGQTEAFSEYIARVQLKKAKYLNDK